MEVADEAKDPKASAPGGEGQPKPAAPTPSPAKPAGSEKKPAAAAEEKPTPVKQSNDDTRALMARGVGAEQVEDIRPNIAAFKVPADRFLDAISYVHGELGYDHLACITAIDWKQGKLEVVYNLWSYAKNRPLALRVAVPAENPVVPSVTGIWKGADWLEREEFDLMGIRFDGHPELRRILLPEGWKGHPLRKDYDWKKEQFVALNEKGEDVVYQEAREDAW